MRVTAWDEADLVPLSAIQHYAYCPRQCALIHVEQVWAENVFTLRGRRAHESVDRTAGMVREGERVEYALPVWSERLGLIGRADVVVFGAGGAPYPVEHKVGPRRARHADELQLCAQALCLEEMFGAAVPKGALFYRGSRRRREVVFSPTLRSEVERIVGAVRSLLREERLPSPVADARCRHCSLIEVCMPFVVSSVEPTDDVGTAEEGQRM